MKAKAGWEDEDEDGDEEERREERERERRAGVLLRWPMLSAASRPAEPVPSGRFFTSAGICTTVEICGLLACAARIAVDRQAFWFPPGGDVDMCLWASEHASCLPSVLCSSLSLSLPSSVSRLTDLTAASSPQGLGLSLTAVALQISFLIDYVKLFKLFNPD
ncbi:hypothetical protein VTN00DRAFT_1088 [Thermoascus crustaceus]|uniref:uncharacterized protein n=1 Tax=Thermoascus crustaceus TaxID=5088 RepID=UPI0037427E7E